MMNRKIPKDVAQRLEDIASMADPMPIYFEPVDEGLAEFVNHFSEDWVEVFMLFNNEDGAHYFFQTVSAT